MGTSARERLEAKKFDSLLATLSNRFGADEAAEIWVDAERHLEDLLATTQELTDGERMHVEGFIYPMCALFLAIAEACGREDAKRICADFMRETALAKGASLQRLLQIPGMKHVFIRVFGVMGEKLFGEKAGFGQVMHESTGSRLRMDITACPYKRHCDMAGAPEIAPLFCANDEYCYGNLPGIAFQRTGTIANGAERCDFELTLM